MKKFKKWILTEKADIFGFDKQRQKSEKGFVSMGAMGFKPEMIMDELARVSLGIKKPVHDWCSKVQWGTDTGSLKVEIGTFGSLKINVERKINDLEGNEIWLCKRVIAVNKTKFGNEQDVVASIHDTLKEVDGEMINMPIKDFDRLENLVVSLATQMKIKAPRFFMTEGIKKVNKNHYLIHWAMNGLGAEAPTARRVEQFDVHIQFIPETGIIRSWGCDISSPMRQHLWQIQPSEWNLYFAPTQPKQEIIESIVRAFEAY